MMVWNPILGAATGVFILAAALALWLLLRTAGSESAKARPLRHIPRWLALLGLAVALLDPALVSVRREPARGRLLVLEDVSASMDIADREGVARRRRAGEIVEKLKARLPPEIEVTRLPFDTKIHTSATIPGNTGTSVIPNDPASEPARATDLAHVLEEARPMAEKGAALAAVLLTDGGDERLSPPSAFPVPLHVLGLGASAGATDDVAIEECEHPESAEEGAKWTCAPLLRAHALSDAFRARLAKVRLSLDELEGKVWQERAAIEVDLGSGISRPRFELVAGTEGVHRFRLRVTPLQGELTALNNERHFRVEVGRKSIRVLYYSRSIGAELKHLRAELARDPSVTFTALFRTREERFALAGERKAGEEAAAGLEEFPAQEKPLSAFDVIILDSFPAGEWTAGQLQALSAWVDKGGSVVFLAGAQSYGAGGYAGTPLEALLPWRIENGRGALESGSTALQAAPGARSHPMLAGIEDFFANPAEAVSEGMQDPGPLKEGAQPLLEATGGRARSAVVFMTCGRGKVLAFATNTLWRWSRGTPAQRRAYGLLWRQAVRFLAGKSERAGLIAARWNATALRPGEEAEVLLEIPSARAGEDWRLFATLQSQSQSPGASVPVACDPVEGRPGSFRARFTLKERGAATFKAVLHQGDRQASLYDREIEVLPPPEEGSRLALDETLLSGLAKRSGGRYSAEEGRADWITDVAATLSGEERRSELRLVQAGTPWPWFPLGFCALLVGEWWIRRRMNLP